MATHEPNLSHTLRTVTLAKNRMARKTETRDARVREFIWRTEKMKKAPIEFLENGLMSMENAPAHVASIAKRDAQVSPLLRLPGEIRNKIWEELAAASGQNIVICAEKGPSLYSPNVGLLPSLFQLPKVCRQIYTETAIFRYRFHTFNLYAGKMSTEAWMMVLLPIQRDTITTVIIKDGDLGFYKETLRKQLFKAVFPNLGTLMILSMPSNLLRELHRETRREPYRRLVLERYQIDQMWRRLRRCIPYQGKDVQVVFRQDDL